MVKSRQELVKEARDGNRARDAAEQARLMRAAAVTINNEIVAAVNDGDVSIEVNSPGMSFENRIAKALFSGVGLRGRHNGEPDHCLACLAFHIKLGEVAA